MSAPSIKPKAWHVDSDEALAGLLDDFRISKGISAAELARRLHVSPSVITMRENGRRALSISKAAEHLREVGYALVVVPLSEVQR